MLKNCVTVTKPVAYTGISKGGGQRRKGFENPTRGFWARSLLLLKKICNFEVKI